MLGKEPVYSNGAAAGYAISAAPGYTVRKPIAYVRLPVGTAEGHAVSIVYSGERISATVTAEPADGSADEAPPRVVQSEGAGSADPVSSNQLPASSSNH